MKSEMERDILKVLVTEEELKARITEMGAELYEQFHGKNPLFLGVLKGSFVFMADLGVFQLVHMVVVLPEPVDTQQDHEGQQYEAQIG